MRLSSCTRDACLLCSQDTGGQLVETDDSLPQSTSQHSVHDTTSNFSLYRGGSCRASGAMNANMPFMEDFQLRADGLMARQIPKSLTLVTNETTFNNTLLGLRS